MYESIQRSPGAQQVISNPKKYYKTVDKIKPSAAEEQYSAGMYQLTMANRENAKQAYNFFLKADKFIPGYKDVEQMIDEAYHRSMVWKSTIRLVLIIFVLAILSYLFLTSDKILTIIEGFTQ